MASAFNPLSHLTISVCVCLRQLPTVSLQPIASQVARLQVKSHHTWLRLSVFKLHCLAFKRRGSKEVTLFPQGPLFPAVGLPPCGKDHLPFMSGSGPSCFRLACDPFTHSLCGNLGHGTIRPVEELSFDSLFRQLSLQLVHLWTSYPLMRPVFTESFPCVPYAFLGCWECSHEAQT